MSQLLPVWLSMGEIYMFAILNAFHEMIRHEKSFIFDTKQTLICKFRYFFFCLNSGKQLTLSLTSIIEGHACQVQLSLSSSNNIPEKPILFRILLRRWRKLSCSLNGRIQTKSALKYRRLYNRMGRFEICVWKFSIKSTTVTECKYCIRFLTHKKYFLVTLMASFNSIFESAA